MSMAKIVPLFLGVVIGLCLRSLFSTSMLDVQALGVISVKKAVSAGSSASGAQRDKLGLSEGSSAAPLSDAKSSPRSPSFSDLRRQVDEASPAPPPPQAPKPSAESSESSEKAESEKSDWQKETEFLEKILRSFGKLKKKYKGKQRLLGFQPGRLFDENGMFAFDGSIKSVAIDVGAANNPLTFDLGIDATQLVMMFEALPGHSQALEKAFEQDINAAWRRGGCNTHWDPVCMSDRFMWWRAAVSPSVGMTNFIISDSPYCGSLGDFTEKSGSGIDPKLAKDPEMNGWLKACYNTKSKAVKVFTVTLASIISRIPKNIRIKYVKIDAQGHDFKVLMTAGEHLSRLEYVRFEMQVDPPPNRKMVKDVPSYAEVVKFLKEKGFTHEGSHACNSNGMGAFSKAIKEMECSFCRKKPCREGGATPLGISPGEVVKRKDSWKSLVTIKAPPQK